MEIPDDPAELGVPATLRGTWTGTAYHKLVGIQPEDLELEMERTGGTARGLGGPSCAAHTEVHLRTLPDGRAAYTYGTHLGVNFTATLARRRGLA